MDKNLLSRLYRHGVQLMAVGIVTGLLAGIVVTYFNIAAELLSKYSKDLYALVRENPAFVPLLFVVLAIIAFGIATLAKFVEAAFRKRKARQEVCWNLNGTNLFRQWRRPALRA